MPKKEERVGKAACGGGANRARSRGASVVGAMLRLLTHPALNKAAWRCFYSIFYNFFFLQYKAALKPGRVPVSSVDHELDNAIPFSPKWVGIYLDFVPFWLRICGLLLKTYRKRAIPAVNEFVTSMGRVYSVAAEVYVQNLSTTKRPRYLATPRFALIHAFDPHLMCIPSLHVMVVVRAYTKFRAIVRAFGDEQSMAHELDEAWKGAIIITESLLYVKQHSVNCVAAALYTMTRFEEALFLPEEARRFVSALFKTGAACGASERNEGRDVHAGIPIPPETQPDAEQRASIETYIWDLYRRFLDEGKTSASWEEPLLRFLRERLP
jgi:hypothetical protein